MKNFTNLIAYFALTLAITSASFAGLSGPSSGGGGGSGDALVANSLAQFAATTSLELKGVLSDETGSGAACFATSPTLVTPNLGTPSAATLTNATGLPIATGISGLGAGVATWAATPSSANLASAVTGETGSGALVFGTSPTLTTPDLGTPSALTLTNATGLPIATGVSGLGTDVAAWLADATSAKLATAVTNETGTGALVFADSPTFSGTVAGITKSMVGLGNVTNVATDDTAYDATSWNGNTDAPTKNAIRDKIETLSGGSPGGSDTQVQYNNAGSFGGSSFLALNETDKRAVVNAGNATASELLFLQGTTTGTTQASDGFKIGFSSGGSNTVEFNQRESASIQFKTPSLTNIDMTSTYTDIRGSGGYKIVTDANGIGLNANTSSTVRVIGAGTFGWPTKPITGTNTLATGDSWIVSNDATSAAYTLNLATNGQQAGRLTAMYKKDATNNSVTLDPPSTNTISGVTTMELQSMGDAVIAYADQNDGKHFLLAESRASKIQSITANTTLVADNREQFIECDPTAAGGNVTATAFAATGYRGWKVHIINTGTANDCIFDGNSTEQIWEAGTSANTGANITSGNVSSYVSNGTLWRRYANE